MRAFLIVAASALAALALAGPAHATRTANLDIGSVPAEVAFNDRPNAQVDPTIFDQVVRLLDGAQNGSSVHIALFSIGRGNRIVDALVRARRRGVQLNIVYDKQDGKLAPLTRGNEGPPPQIVNCQPGACLSNKPKAIMHAKFMLLSSVRRNPSDALPTPNVTWVSSANMTANSGSEMFNNAIAYYGDGDLYRSLLRVWNDMAGKIRVADYFQPPGRGVFGSAAARTEGYVSPEGTRGSDLMLRILRKVKPTRRGCQIDVMQAFFTNARIRVARRLRALQRRGCRVRVVVNAKRKGGKIAMGSRVKRVIRGERKGRHIHDKVVLIRGTYEGRRNRTVVLTGSHNMSAPANGRNDEVLLGVYDVPALYLTFLAHFNDGYPGPP